MDFPDAGGDARLRSADVCACGVGRVSDGKSAANPAGGGRIRVHRLRRDHPVSEAAVVFPCRAGRPASAGSHLQTAGAGRLSPVLESDAQYLYRRDGLGASRMGDAAACGEKWAVPDAVCCGGRKRYSADLLLAERPGTGGAGSAAARRRVGGNGGFQDRRGTSRIGRAGGCHADSYLQRVAEPESGVPGHIWLDSLRNCGGIADALRVGFRRTELGAENRRR